MALGEYTKKRRFDKTTEPEGKIKNERTGELVFVVQKHNASHLHYDFRLEMEGVLKSWAVPKGPSLRPEDKRLAMMVEDHPFDYRNFEGVIPKGNYGAGQVIVWDKGTYEPRKAVANPEAELLHELNKGHLTFVMHGEKLNGEYALVKSPHMGENAWLLIKKDDEFAKDRNVVEQGRSVVSGKTIDGVDNDIDLSGAPEVAYPRELKPMLATLTDAPFDDKEWLYEIKWDGYRAIGGWDGREPMLYSRSGTDFLDHYPPIAEALRSLKVPAVIDGEIVVLDSSGKSRFEDLQNWRRRKQGTLVYYAFDILWCDGHDLTDWPLSKRKEMLKKVVEDSETIKYSDHVVGEGKKFFQQVSRMELEGMMAKKADSIYREGFRSKLWLKVKTHKRQEVVIGGFTEPKGSREHIGSLIVGVCENNKLEYVGHVGGGIPPRDLLAFRKRLLALEQGQSPFTAKFKPNGEVHWIRPELVCEVSFSEWTSEGHMRHPIFMGMREDKNPSEVIRENPIEAESTIKEEDQMASERVEFTHLDKVFFPKTGQTKGDLVAYYKQFAPLMLPYIKDHPCNLLRHPNGASGKSFYQKDMNTMSIPDWIKTVSIYSESNEKDISYFVIDSTDALLYLIQLGSIEINPWSSKTDNLNNPLWAVIDLDPEDVPFEQVVDVALEVKKVCDRLEIPSYPKTSGQTGIHVFIPTGGKYSYEQVRQFSELIANMVQQTTEPVTSLVRSPSKRQHKIYLDYLQNRQGQTLAAPYSVRPTPVASVSTPLRWSEVNKNLRPENFTIKNMQERIAEVGDLWKPVIGEGVDIAKAIARLE